MRASALVTGGQPECSISISPLFHALRKGDEAPRAEPPHDAPGEASAPDGSGEGGAGGATLLGRPERIALSSRHRLRRDGGRPIIFEGTLLLRLARYAPPEAEGGTGQTPPESSAGDGPLQTFELFETNEGSIIGAIRMEPQEQLASRPVYVARQISGPLDLASFLDEYDPMRAPGANARQAAVLKADFDRMLAESALRVSHLGDGDVP